MKRLQFSFLVTHFPRSKPTQTRSGSFSGINLYWSMRTDLSLFHRSLSLITCISCTKLAVDHDAVTKKITCTGKGQTKNWVSANDWLKTSNVNRSTQGKSRFGKSWTNYERPMYNNKTKFLFRGDLSRFFVTVCLILRKKNQTCAMFLSPSFSCISLSAIFLKIFFGSPTLRSGETRFSSGKIILR